MYSIAIDLGGTNIKAGIIDGAGHILAKAQAPTGAERHYSEIIKDMASIGMKAADEAGISMDEIDWVGIGSPGTVDNKNGVLVYSNNINFLDVPMRSEMQKHINKPVYIGNDANCAAWGEYSMLENKAVKEFVFITLGTGIGGGVVIDGRLCTGFNGAGYELGHMVLAVDGPACTCGRNGCWEALGSVTALIRMTKETVAKHGSATKMYELCEGDLEKIGGKTAFIAAKDGDGIAYDLVQTWIRYVAEGIINTINIFQPEILSIGGAISKEGDYILNPIKEHVQKSIYTRNVPQTTLTIAKLGNDAGLIGAGFLGNEK